MSGGYAIIHAPLRWWVTFTSTAESAVSDRIATLSKRCATHPWKCIFLMLLICFLCGGGMVRFEQENEGRELWVDQNSDPMHNLRYIEEHFADMPRRTRLVFTARDGGSVLTMTAFGELFTALDELRALGGEGKRFEDLCLAMPNGVCRGQGVLRYFNTSRSVFNAMVRTDEDILHAVNSPVFPDDKSRAFPEDNMGGIHRDTTGQITSATAVRMDFLLDGAAELESMLDWELEVQEHFVDEESGLINQPYASVNIFVMAMRSAADELARTVG
eukprot:6298319-Amphidinium_carterae.1